MKEFLGQDRPRAGGTVTAVPWNVPAVGYVERLVVLALRMSALIPVLVSLAVASLLLRGAWSASEGLAWPSVGLTPLILGTVVVAGVAVGLAAPIGLLAAIYLSEFAPHSVRRWLKPSLELLAGIPTIVYALIAVWVVGPAIHRLVPAVSIESGLVAGLVLALMIIPTISSLSEDALRQVPRSLREASLALGASRLRMLRVVVLPTAAHGIVAAVMLGLSRAVAETMIMMMAAGHRPSWSLDPTGAVESLTGYLGRMALSDPSNSSMYTAAIALLLISLLAHALAHRLIRRRGRWQ